MTLESSRTLGGIGAILLLIGLIPFAEPYLGVIALIGFILVLIALHGLGNFYKEDRIFDNALYGFIAAIVGVVAAVVAAIYIIFYTSIVTSFLDKIYPGWNGSWSSLVGLTPTTSGITFKDVAPVLGAVFSVLVILWVFLIISSFFNRRSLKMLSTKTNVGLFSTAGLLLLIGAVLVIVFIGVVLMWIAVLLMAIAFFQIKPTSEQAVSSTAPSPQTLTP
ncbi:MAG TPA: DUF996 domain-containing protein [Candidatus Acidoferrum sp.]|nr:DUF996 domain-containing protein [Candidatus Acidoferrum sp.]